MFPGLLHNRSIPENTFTSAPHKRGQADCDHGLQFPFGLDHLLGTTQARPRARTFPLIKIQVYYSLFHPTRSEFRI